MLVLLPLVFFVTSYPVLKLFILSRFSLILLFFFFYSYWCFFFVLFFAIIEGFVNPYWTIDIRSKKDKKGKKDIFIAGFLSCSVPYFNHCGRTARHECVATIKVTININIRVQPLFLFFIFLFIFVFIFLVFVYFLFYFFFLLHFFFTFLFLF